MSFYKSSQQVFKRIGLGDISLNNVSFMLQSGLIDKIKNRKPKQIVWLNKKLT